MLSPFLLVLLENCERGAKFHVNRCVTVRRCSLDYKTCIYNIQEDHFKQILKSKDVRITECDRVEKFDINL